MDQILRRVPLEHGVVVDTARGLRIAALAYADDVVLLSNTLASAELLLRRFETTARLYGLLLNIRAGKTEFMCFAHNSMRLPPLDMRCAAGEIGQASTYRYLGWRVRADSYDWEEDLSTRRRQAWFLLRRHDAVWRSGASLRSKRQLFRALIIPTLLYAASTYPPTLRCQRLLHVTCNALLRAALQTRIHWSDAALHVPTLHLYRDIPFVPGLVCRWTLAQWGHWVRLAAREPHCPPCVEATLSDPPGTRRGRRPWSMARILLAHGGHDLTSDTDVGLDLLHDLPLGEKKWGIFASRRARETLTEFVRRYVLKVTLSRHVTGADYDRQIASWFPIDGNLT